MKHAILFAAVLFIGGIGTPTTLFAQESCGSIIEYYDYGDGNGPVIDSETPIEDCGNPFGIAEVDPALVVTYGDTTLEHGSTYAFLTGTAHPWNITGYTSEYADGVLYLHSGSDYVLKQYIPNGGSYTFTEAGTYTFVVSEMYSPVMTREGTFERLRELLIPTAFASYIGPALAITFTVTEPIPEPVGISNILFLPGIQASRLYMQENGEEEKLWEPFGDDDVEMLRMSETGESINDVYTKDVVDEKGGVAIGGNIYKGFLEYLRDIEGPFAGPIIETFPYDWRDDVFGVVENGTNNNGEIVYPTNTVETLAGVSPTGKVTIIAHSNGGLLAKAIMLKLEEEGKTNLVDKIIFIASPHIGTPKGIAALLHGFDQRLGFGIIATDKAVRNVIQNMPGVYGLLPSETYIESLNEPLISFDGSTTTKIFRDAYGFTLSNMDEYTQFLVGDEGREDPGDSINKPSTANAGMLTQALAQHRTKLDNWNAPAGVEVFNIVGTGLPTAKSIEYQEFNEVTCYGGGPVGSCTQPTTKLEAVIYFTRYGDETVISKSAKHANGNTIYFNLLLEAVGISNFKNTHSNITESETTQTLVDHILHGSSTDGIDFASTTEPTFSDDGLDVHRIHSPVHIFLRDDAGNITGTTEVGGEWRSEIFGSDYFEIGGVKYVLVPSDSTYTVVIEGEENGIYTHSMNVFMNEEETTHHTYTASVTPTSVMEYTKGDNGEFSTITIDENGDGMTDKEMTLEGEIIEKEVTYDDLKDAIRELNLPRKYERPLLVLVTQAEKFSHHHVKKHKKVHAKDVLLKLIQKQLEWYKKVGLITGIQFDETNNIIEKLIEK